MTTAGKHDREERRLIDLRLASPQVINDIYHKGAVGQVHLATPSLLLSFRIFVNNASNLEGIVARVAGWPFVGREAVNDSENVTINSPFQRLLRGEKREERERCCLPHHPLHCWWFLLHCRHSILTPTSPSLPDVEAEVRKEVRGHKSLASNVIELHTLLRVS